MIIPVNVISLNAYHKHTFQHLNMSLLCTGCCSILSGLHCELLLYKCFRNLMIFGTYWMQRAHHLWHMRISWDIILVKWTSIASILWLRYDLSAA